MSKITLQPPSLLSNIKYYYISMTLKKNKEQMQVYSQVHPLILYRIYKNQHTVTFIIRIKIQKRVQLCISTGKKTAICHEHDEYSLPDIELNCISVYSLDNQNKGKQNSNKNNTNQARIDHVDKLKNVHKFRMKTIRFV